MVSYVNEMANGPLVIYYQELSCSTVSVYLFFLSFPPPVCKRYTFFTFSLEQLFNHTLKLTQVILRLRVPIFKRINEGLCPSQRVYDSKIAKIQS